MTETALTPDTYAPSVGDDGKYFDISASVTFAKNSPGIGCGCGSRTVFKTRQGFMQHCARPIHKKWLTMLDNESKNHFKELQKARETIRHQQLLIARRDRRITELERTISTITINQNLTKDGPNPPTGDLLGFD